MQLWAFDVTQAYLHSATELACAVYVEHSKELCVEELNLFRILNALCMIKDAGGYWHRTFRGVLESALGMRPSH